MANLSWLQGGACSGTKEPELAPLQQLSRRLFPVDPSPKPAEDYAAALAEMRPVKSGSWTTRDERLFAPRFSSDVVVVVGGSSALKLRYSLVVVQAAVRDLRVAA